MRKVVLLFCIALSFGYVIGQTDHALMQPVFSNDEGTPVTVSQANAAGGTFVTSTGETDVMTVWALPVNGGGSTNSRIPRNSTYRYQRCEYLITPTEMATSGFPAGNTIDAIGFSISTAGVGTQTGTLNIYLRNTTDVGYTLGSTWTTAGFTQVHSDAAFTVPIALGNYTINFTGGSPFTYTGGGVYVAWEFSNPSGALGTTALTCNCNTTQTTMCYGYQNATAMGTSLAVTAYRPATLFTNNTIVDILQVTNIYAQEKCPVPYGVPTNLTARVVNVSASPETFNVTMTITDQATSTVRYTNTQTVTALAGNTAQVVTFTPWNATILEDVNITVTVPGAAGETFLVNNSKVIPVNINNNLFGFCYNNVAANGYGFTSGSGGIFATKFHMNGAGTIPSANLFIYNYAANVGNTIYAVVINAAGTIVAQSANLVIASGNLNSNVNFTFPTPPAFNNEDFYVGLAQPTIGTWFPMGVMAESPYRANVFFTFALTGGTGTPRTVDYKLMIEAIAAPTALLSDDVGTLSIDMGRVINTGTTSPKATVKNFGANTETFNVTMTNGVGYTSTQTVTALGSGMTTQVTFDPWTPAPGDYTMNVCTSLPGDLDPTNDCKTQNVKVMNLNKQVYGYLAFAGTGTDPVGPTSFNLSSPGTLNSIANQSTENFVNGGTWAEGIWYGTVYSTAVPYNFISIDPSTGTRTIIGDMGVGMNGLSYNPADGIMYAISATSLYTINMTTGLATLVGTNSGIQMINFAINSAGQAYAVDITLDQLGTVNLTTGAFTAIGSIGFNANYAQDMEFDRQTGDLFMAAQDLSSGWLGWVNTSTGQVLKIGDFEGGGEITGFAIPYIPAMTTVTGTVTSEENPCYNATNTITVGGTAPFTIQAGGSAIFIAGFNILFEPGTMVPAGAYMHGYISTTYCGGQTDAPMVAANAPETQMQGIDQAWFSIYPNPTSGNVTIGLKGDLPAGDLTVEIYSMRGERVMNTRLIGTKQQEISTASLPNGIYFVKLTGGANTQTVKLVKTR